MSLFIGDHVVKLDKSGQPIMDPNGSEVHVEFEVIEVSGYVQMHDPNTGEFSHEAQFALLKKVR